MKQSRIANDSATKPDASQQILRHDCAELGSVPKLDPDVL
jgi:hypothetical protein